MSVTLKEFIANTLGQLDDATADTVEFDVGVEPATFSTNPEGMYIVSDGKNRLRFTVTLKKKIKSYD